VITPITHFAHLSVRHRLSLLLHDRPNLLTCACVIDCLECCLSEIVVVLEGGNADKPNLLTCACVIGCFKRVCAVWVLAMSQLEGRRNYRCMCRIVERKGISRGITTNPKRKRRLE
jgi:hypothetical protein